jgi:hypothetical protein
MNWRENFSERQQKEIQFAELYADQFSHGTDGHNAKLIIAKMAKILSDVATNATLDDDPVDRIRRIRWILWKSQ